MEKNYNEIDFYKFFVFLLENYLIDFVLLMEIMIRLLFQK